MSQKEYIITVHRCGALSICTREERDEAAHRTDLKRARRREAIFGTLGWLAFLWLMGAVGGMDMGTMGLATGAIHSILALAAMIFCAGQAHAFYGQEAAATWNKQN